MSSFITFCGTGGQIGWSPLKTASWSEVNCGYYITYCHHMSHQWVTLPFSTEWLLLSWHRKSSNAIKKKSIIFSHAYKELRLSIILHSLPHEAMAVGVYWSPSQLPWGDSRWLPGRVTVAGPHRQTNLHALGRWEEAGVPQGHRENDCANCDTKRPQAQEWTCDLLAVRRRRKPLLRRVTAII